VALSGAQSPEVNLIVCSGSDPEILRRSLADVAEVGAPSVIAIAAAALGSSQVLADAGWVCVGAAPFMRMAACDVAVGAADPHVRRLGAGDLETARDLLAIANSQPRSVAVVAIPDLAVESEETSLWGIDADGSLAVIVAGCTVADAAGLWSMATHPGHRRQGYGRRLLETVLAELASSGIDHMFGSSSSMGEPLYRSLGFSVLEYWQQWSRPRWILGRT
jgi:GNAT superfamily N-acetyltransferase